MKEIKLEKNPVGVIFGDGTKPFLYGKVYATPETVTASGAYVSEKVFKDECEKAKVEFLGAFTSMDELEAALREHFGEIPVIIEVEEVKEEEKDEVERPVDNSVEGERLEPVRQRDEGPNVNRVHGKSGRRYPSSWARD